MSSGVTVLRTLGLCKSAESASHFCHLRKISNENKNKFLVLVFGLRLARQSEKLPNDFSAAAVQSTKHPWPKVNQLTSSSCNLQLATSNMQLATGASALSALSSWGLAFREFSNYNPLSRGMGTSVWGSDSHRSGIDLVWSGFLYVSHNGMVFFEFMIILRI